MAPFGSDNEDMEKIMSQAAAELGILLTEYIGGMQWECIKNPDRKFWQFWKKKYIFVELKSPKEIV